MSAYGSMSPRFLEAEEMPPSAGATTFSLAYWARSPRLAACRAFCWAGPQGACHPQKVTVDWIRQAARAVELLDPRYVVNVVRGAQPRMWRVGVRRRHLMPHVAPP